MPLPMRRHSDGAPMLLADNHWWEDGVNLECGGHAPSANQSNRELITQLLAGTVYYNAASR